MHPRPSNWTARFETIARATLGLMLLAAACWAVADGYGGR